MKPREAVRYVLHKGSHGLGNRLYTLSTAINYCKRTGAQLVVDWNDDAYSDGRNVFWEAFRLVDCQAIVAPDQNPASLNGLGTAEWGWRGRYEAKDREVYRIVNKTDEFAYKDWHDIPPLSGLRQIGSQMRPEGVIVLCGFYKPVAHSLALLRHLRLSRAFEDRLRKDLAKLHAAFGHGKCMIGIHSRSATRDIFAKVDFEGIRKFAMRQAPGGKVFLATDTKAEVDRARGVFGSELVVAEKFFPQVGNPTDEREVFGLHRCSSEQLSGFSKLEILYQAVRDLQILASGSALFAQPHSTFSEIATLFFQRSASRVYPNSPCSLKATLGIRMRAAKKYLLGARIENGLLSS